MAKDRVPEQPNKEAEKELSDILGNEIDYVTVRGQQWGFRWLRNGTKRKITSVMLRKDEKDDEDEDKVVTKCVAAMRLNDYWKIKFFYGILWRWMYYIKQYTYEELLPVTAMIKKKAPAVAYFVNITSLTEMKDTMMAMSREEVERTRQELLMAQLGQLEKSTNTSQQPKPSSEDSSQSKPTTTTGDTPQPK